MFVCLHLRPSSLLNQRIWLFSTVLGVCWCEKVVSIFRLDICFVYLSLLEICLILGPLFLEQQTKTKSASNQKRQKKHASKSNFTLEQTHYKISFEEEQIISLSPNQCASSTSNLLFINQCNTSLQCRVDRVPPLATIYSFVQSQRHWTYDEFVRGIQDFPFSPWHIIEQL